MLKDDLDSKPTENAINSMVKLLFPGLESICLASLIRYLFINCSILNLIKLSLRYPNKLKGALYLDVVRHLKNYRFKL